MVKIELKLTKQSDIPLFKNIFSRTTICSALTNSAPVALEELFDDIWGNQLIPFNFKKAQLPTKRHHSDTSVAISAFTKNILPIQLD